MGGISGILKPTDREIRVLARRETDPRQAARFEPICRGPLFALVAIPLVVLAALPFCLLRLLQAPFGRDVDPE